jgi:Chaperone of endosialidase/Stigma-specific protein, Stig1
MDILAWWLAPFAALGVVVIGTGCSGATVSGIGDASADGAAESGSGSGGSSGGSGGSSGGGSGSSSGGGVCSPACEGGFLCCNGQCIDPSNNPEHCGDCSTTCSGQTPFCGHGKCGVPVCDQECSNGSCCGNQCCTGAQICCEVDGPVDVPTRCFTPTASQPTCPPGCLTCVSDRNVKRDIEPVDPQAVLEGVARLPVSTWSYKKDDPSVRHMGPMAQDLYAAFGLGDTDKAYSVVDAHGIALAAIQALYQRVEDQNGRIEKLEKENRELRRRGRGAVSP